jgi:adenosylmethionine-8-amino-7-oxononanoate aminotransferase
MNKVVYYEPSETPKYVTKTDGYWIHYKGEKEPCLDLTTGYGAFLLGYNNRTVIDAMYKNLDVQFVRGHTADVSEQVEELVKFISKKGDWPGVSWAVSGSDGVEAAIYANDEYWKMTTGYRPNIISLAPGYHGATFISRHLRGDYPEVDRARIVRSPQWNSVEERVEEESRALGEIRQLLEQDKEKQIGCLIMETSPWVGNMCPWSANWWKEIRKICDEFEIIWILDDVAVCWGKHGTWFGYEPFGVKPDMNVFGKALTGGYSPLSAVAFNEKISNVLTKQNFEYGHTWHPNLWGVAASLAVSKYIEDNNLLSRVAAINKEFKNIANEYGFKIRGDFLFSIMETPRRITSGELHDVGLSTGLPTNDANTGNIKFCTPLTADDEYFYTLKSRLKLLF